MANRTLSNVLRAVKSPYNVNTVSQAFGAVVLSHREEEQKALAQILESRDALYGALSRMQEKAGCFERVYPTVTNFVLVKTDRAQEIFEKLKTPLDRGALYGRLSADHSGQPCGKQAAA